MSDVDTFPRSYGHYRIVTQIGSGGMGAVYLAEDTVLDRKVALKILLDEVAKDKERIRRFIQEAKAASALNHPNILTIFEIGEAHGSHYLVTELIQGETLRDLIRKGSRDISKKIGIGIQAAAALDAAHERGIIHRDIKPENIMVREDGLVKVLDFGLAKLATSADLGMSDAATLEHYKTAPGIVVGTAAYMSPEQARGLELDARSDAFSLGTVMYELLTGKHPFPGESHADIVSSILREEPAPIRERIPEAPPELERIIERLIRKDRDDRYQNFKELRVDLEELRDELRFESKNSQAKLPPLTPTAEVARDTSFRSAFTSTIVEKRRFTLLHALLSGLLAISGFAGLWFLSSKLFPPPPEPGTYPTAEVAIWTSIAGELSSEARFSPDGKLIAYSSTRSGSMNVWVTQASSPNPIQVTNDTNSNSQPMWSPKGDEIAFFSIRANHGGEGKDLPGIWRVPAFGGTPRLIGTVPFVNSMLRYWSPSGKIYFEVKQNLFAMDVASGTVSQETSFESNSFTWIDISKDERRIAYLRRDGENWTISTGNIDGSNAQEAAHGTGDIDNSIVWNQEKNVFFYGAKVAGVRQIFRTTGSPDSSIRITALESDCSMKDVSPDGRSIITGSAKEEVDLWRVSVEGKEQPVVKDLDETLWPSVSPDSKRVVYQSTRTMVKGDKIFETSIAIKDILSANDGTRPSVIAERGFLPIWSPVGSQVAFLQRAGKDFDLMIADAASGVAAVKIAQDVPVLGYSVTPYDTQHSFAFSWAPDGASIAYPSDKSGASNIWQVDPTNGHDQRLTENSDTNTTYFSPVWSPDGAKLAYYFQTRSSQPGKMPTRGVMLFDRKERKATQLFMTQTVFALIGWSEDGNSLLIISCEKEFSSQVQSVTISSLYGANGGKVDLVKVPNAYFFDFFVSPDRRWIAYAGRENGYDDIWILPSSGGTPRKITSNNDPDVFYSRLAWQPDGNAIIFGKQTRFSLLSLVTDIE